METPVHLIEYILALLILTINRMINLPTVSSRS